MDTIKNWNDIIDNLREFSYVTKHEKTFALDKFSQFSHWYYFPNEDTFAPSKFLGYRNTKIDKYEGKGWGGVTQNALSRYFDQVPSGSNEFKNLYSKLESFANSLNKKISFKTRHGTGGIHMPKKEYNQAAQYSQKLYDVSAADISAIKDEDGLEEIEGAKKTKLVNFYERIPALRAKAIQLHGLKCEVCGFNFKDRYGVHGVDFIEVHHLKPLHTYIDPSLVNPKTDMAVLCANCHRMIHRNKNVPLTIDQLKELWKKYNS
ncbi:MAG: HNH endonuclease [Bacteroidetes bacterium]|nr:HNH endonuclease [Bacteroidota bacterium]